MKIEKGKRELKPEAIAKIKKTQFKPKWQHMPTELVRIPKLLVPFLKAIAQELDEELFLIVEDELPIETIEVLLPQLSSGRLEQLQGKLEKLIPRKRKQEAEQERKENYKITIFDSEPDSSKIAVYSPYDPTGERQRICKSISGYSFDGSDKSWHFPLDSIVEVLEAFPEEEYYWKDERLKQLYEKEKQRRKKEEERLRREESTRQQQEKLNRMLFESAIEEIVHKIDEPLANDWTLRNYQKEAVNWLIHRHRGGIYPGGILADDMGLGKTIEALFAAKLLHLNYCIVERNRFCYTDNYLRKCCPNFIWIISKLISLIQNY